MNKNYNSIVVMLLLLAVLFGTFFFMMPQISEKASVPLSEFSTKRTLEKIKTIAQQPHYVGSKNHDEVALYLQKELQNLGLQTSFQEGFTMTEKGTLVQSKNILARIKGSENGKALVLLSHYDSAPHSFSKGASDDASGVATILESVRAFLYNNSKNKNDIIILFSDAEELGLNGAALFVTQHQWAKNVGLVLNFEARGSAGPSYMLMETNKGNAQMVEAFSDGKTQFPASNSLMYSIYKMLPNDTDLTVFREKGAIQGFNFAFIDHHYNYHTMQDDFENISPKTIAHQGSYLMPLLSYFSNADLSNLNSEADEVYFTVPFAFIHYPFNWINPMWIGVLALFVLFILIGIGKRLIVFTDVVKGAIPLFKSLILSGLLTFAGWKLLLLIYPQYADILHGFTYNGNDYMYAFIALTLAICFFSYSKYTKAGTEMNQLIVPLLIWIGLTIAMAYQLKGASFLIIPVFFAVLTLGFYVITQKNVWWLSLLFSIPTILIIAPFVQMFPVGLGLKIMFGSAILTVLAFVLMLPVFGTFGGKKLWGTLFLLVSFGFFINAHFNSNYAEGKAKPNSLLYLINADTQKAYWTTYDQNLDNWTKTYLGNNPQHAEALNTDKLYSKYGSKFTFMKNAELIKVPQPTIDFVTDSVFGNKHFYKIVITPNRKVNRYDLFANEKLEISNLKANNAKSLDIKSNIINKKTNKILSYYVVNNIPLTLEFSIPLSQKLDLHLMESSFDLLQNPLMKIKPRSSWMIATPFVLNDAVVIKQQVKPSPKIDTLPTPKTKKWHVNRFVKPIINE
jgi:hypothetical protein